jgi:hypothetical protein
MNSIENLNLKEIKKGFRLFPEEIPYPKFKCSNNQLHKHFCQVVFCFK